MRAPEQQRCAKPAANRQKGAVPGVSPAALRDIIFCPAKGLRGRGQRSNFIVLAICGQSRYIGLASLLLGPCSFRLSYDLELCLPPHPAERHNGKGTHDGPWRQREAGQSDRNSRPDRTGGRQEKRARPCGMSASRTCHRVPVRLRRPTSILTAVAEAVAMCAASVRAMANKSTWRERPSAAPPSARG